MAVELVDGAGRVGSAAGWFEVVLPDGRGVRVPPDFEAARLAELIAVLRSC